MLVCELLSLMPVGVVIACAADRLAALMTLARQTGTETELDLGLELDIDLDIGLVDLELDLDIELDIELELELHLDYPLHSAPLAAFE